MWDDLFIKRENKLKERKKIWMLEDSPTKSKDDKVFDESLYLNWNNSKTI